MLETMKPNRKTPVKIKPRKKSKATKKSKDIIEQMAPLVPIGETIDRIVLKEQRVIHLSGPIDESAHPYLSKLIYYLVDMDKKKPINIVINTIGGSVTDGLAVYDMLVATARNTPIHMIATGTCMSMGMILMQAATDRMATKNCVLMMHELSSANIGTVKRTRDNQDQAERLQGVLDEIIMDRSGLTRKRLDKLIDRKDAYLDADEALENGLIDHILE